MWPNRFRFQKAFAEKNISDGIIFKEMDDGGAIY